MIGEPVVSKSGPLVCTVSTWRPGRRPLADQRRVALNPSARSTVVPRRALPSMSFGWLPVAPPLPLPA